MSAPELTIEAERFLKVGKLFDATGFSGESGEFELYDFIEAASEVIPHHPDTEEFRTYVRSSLAGEARELERKGYSEDMAASYLLGSVMWRVGSSDSLDITPNELDSLLARSVHNIVQSREVFGRGDEKQFQRAFANYTESFGADYPASKRRMLRKLCQRIEHLTYNERRNVMPLAERGERISWGQHIIRGMATIAMVDGYKIQPPHEQTDENGAWQLPHERDEDDDV